VKEFQQSHSCLFRLNLMNKGEVKEKERRVGFRFSLIFFDLLDWQVQGIEYRKRIELTLLMYR